MPKRYVNLSSPSSIKAAIAKGWSPNLYLTNMSVAHFQMLPYGAKELFPIVPVGLQSSHFYKFSKGDLARIQVQDKPAFGKVNPAIMGTSDDLYSCKVKQVIVGIDEIEALNYQRSNTPGSIDPRKSRSGFIAEQMNMKMDYDFGQGFFKTGVWTNEKQGGASVGGAVHFVWFDDASSDPIAVIQGYISAIKKEARRKPNKIGMGSNVYDCLKNHPDVVDRVKYGGSTPNPATVTPQVLAQLFEVDKVVVFESTYNTAAQGATDSMNFILSPKDLIITYAPPAPAIDVPSGGYIFAWDMLGNGQTIAVDQFDGEGGTHTEYMEGLMAYDMKIVAQDCVYYLKDAVQN